MRKLEHPSTTKTSELFLWLQEQSNFTQAQKEHIRQQVDDLKKLVYEKGRMDYHLNLMYNLRNHNAKYK